MTIVRVSDTFWEIRRSICHQYFATLSGSLLILCFGMTLGWVAPSLPKLLAEDSPVPMTSADGSWLAVMPCIGAVFGCFVTAYFVDKVGRKKCLLTASPLYFASWLLIAFADTKNQYNFARLTSGFADGIAFTAHPMYLGEISSAKVRGMLISTISVFTVLGYLVVSLIAPFFDIKWAALVSTIFPLLHFMLFSLMPESPYYYFMKSNKKKALESLEYLRNSKDVQEEYERLEKATEEEMASKGNIWDLFTTASNRSGVYIVVCLRTIQQFCGAMVITFYVGIIIEESKIPPNKHYITIYFAVQLICTSLCSVLVDKVGRKALLLISSVGSCIALSVLSFYLYIINYKETLFIAHPLIPAIALLVYDIVFNVGLGTIPLIILGELFPTSVKGFALCLADIFFGVMVIMASKFFQITQDEFGMHIPFIAFTIMAIIGAFYVIFFIPETKGKTLEEIQTYFKDKTTKTEVTRL